jgi:NAD(P)-dependent dehydrogenase (short-subunit alcohol dehydrogenase family)
MTMDLQGKAALITGAGGGIGREIARILVAGGAQVVLTDIDEAGLEETARLLEGNRQTWRTARADVADDADCAALVTQVIEAFGGLDMAFNNAGIDGATAPLHEQDMATARQVLEVNVMGVLQGMRHQIPPMISRGGGSIVNTASIAGVRGHPGLAPYVASKHAVVGLGRTAAIEYGQQGIRVNTLCPGGVRTEMLDQYLAGAPELKRSIIEGNPMRRMAEAAEVARAAVWLASPEASYINGHALVVDGGKIVSDV